MDITVERKNAAQNHHTRSDLVASALKNQPEKAQAFFSLQQQNRVPSKNQGTHLSGNVSSPGLTCAVSVGEKRKRNEYGKSCSVEHNNRRGSNANIDAERGEELIHQDNSEYADPKFNDFNKLREEGNFAVGQTWALYDTADGMPRLYAKIRRVSASSFGLRITYLEPDPDDEKEIQWFEEGLPVSVVKFRLGKNENTKDISKFSHVIQCNEVSNTGHFTVSPRKGETWALFKNWDIKWSSEPDSHRHYEYEFVEILSDYAHGAGVYVSYLHKAKGFASVFFRMGTGERDRFRILPHSLYRFSHMVPSFKLIGTKGVPKDAYELDQAALPKAVEEIMMPSNSESKRNPKGQDIYFASKGKVFQTGQIWSYCSGSDYLPRYYGKIQKITFTQLHEKEPVLKLHVSRLKKATPCPEDVIEWEDGKMPLGCGTYYPRKVLEIVSSDDISLQVMPQTSMDGKEYTILPKIGEVWVIYRYWSCHIDVGELGCGSYDIVEVLDDTSDYKVLLLENESLHDDDDKMYEYKWFKAVTKYKYNEIDGSEPIFTIPKSERLRFSHKVPALRVTRERYGVLKELIKVDTVALPIALL